MILTLVLCCGIQDKVDTLEQRIEQIEESRSVRVPEVSSIEQRAARVRALRRSWAGDMAELEKNLDKWEAEEAARKSEEVNTIK